MDWLLGIVSGYPGWFARASRSGHNRAHRRQGVIQLHCAGRRVDCGNIIQGGPKVGLQLFHYSFHSFRSNLFLGCSKEQG